MTFEETAKRIIRDLIRDFQLDVPSCAAIVGNFGHETGGFTKLQEIKPTVSGSRGGYGWAQWTGPRRRSYESWCDKHTLDPSTYDANYGFAKYELQNDYAAALKRVRAPGSLRDKVVAFEIAYEGAGVKSYDSRLRYAERALKAFGAVPAPPDIPKPVPVPVKPKSNAGPALGTVVAGGTTAAAAHKQGMSTTSVLIAVAVVIALVIGGVVIWRKIKG
jgi:hypothetical protein